MTLKDLVKQLITQSQDAATYGNGVSKPNDLDEILAKMSRMLYTPEKQFSDLVANYSGPDRRDIYMFWRDRLLYAKIDFENTLNTPRFRIYKDRIQKETVYKRATETLRKYPHKAPDFFLNR